MKETAKRRNTPPENRRQKKSGVQNSEATQWKPGRSGNEATQFKPGASGNAGGRPRTAPFSQACREWLASLSPSDPDGRTNAQVLAARLGSKALDGDIYAARELADRAEGRARQSIEIDNSALREAFDLMNREELERYASDGRLPVWFARGANGGKHEPPIQ